MGDPARDRLSSLPPSAKLVYYVLEKHDRLDQSALAAETRLSARTVRFAIDKLDDANLVEDGVCPTDARRSVYKPASETESSTMPHKVNPIDFENSEGNLSKANSDLTFLADYVTTSRLQRDLSDSTVKRNIGAALAHCLIGYTKTAAGLEKVVPNEQVMREDLEATPEIIGEAVQTILRREGQEDAYEQVKALTRGKSVTLEDFRQLFDDLAVDEDVREELRDLTPTGYTGVASGLVDGLEGNQESR